MVRPFLPASICAGVLPGSARTRQSSALHPLRERQTHSWPLDPAFRFAFGAGLLRWEGGWPGLRAVPYTPWAAGSNRCEDDSSPAAHGASVTPPAPASSIALTSKNKP